VRARWGTNMPEGGIGELLGHNVAGMPGWVWGVAIVGGLAIVYVLPRFSKPAATVTPESQAAIDPITPGSGWVVLPASDTPAPQPPVIPSVAPVAAVAAVAAVAPVAAVAAVAPVAAVAARTYTVVKNDSLWKIAQRFYGSGTSYPSIYTANRATIGSNPSLIQPGMVLRIP
jgi:nucleoid-associated protein YgaU